jgi:hypothetical protein
VPDNVIQPDEMAELLADIHTGESVVEMNYGRYGTEESRRELKQAILEKHGVTQADLDTSFMWYGAHLDKYMAVYDNTAEILQSRLDKNQALEAEQASLSVSGDSVDVWSQPRRYVFTPRSATRYMTFKLSSDKNWNKGDSYTWRAKFFNNDRETRWGVVVEYEDGTTEVLNDQFSSTGWQQITFYTDSTRKATNVRGYLKIQSQNNATATYIDSVQLVRNLINRERYSQRYRQRSFDFSRK